MLRQRHRFQKRSRSTTEHLQTVVIRIVTGVLRQLQPRDTFIPIRRRRRIRGVHLRRVYQQR